MKFLIKLLLIGACFSGATEAQNAPVSPCPKLFQYRFDGAEWYGLLSVRNPDIGRPLHLKVTLSIRGKPTTNYLGEIELLSRGQFRDDTPILYKVLFPKTHIPPRIIQVNVNGRVVCVGAPDISLFVTQIQLEHTRKFTFLSHDVTHKHHQHPGATPTDGGSSFLFPTKSDEPTESNVHTLKDICGRPDENLITETIFQIPTRFQSSINKKSDTKDVSGISRGEWPWLAAIYVNNQTSLSYQCGGTLISPRIVISSAHCFHMYKKQYVANEVLVFLGRHNLKNWNEDGSLAAPVEDVFIHPDYDSSLKNYDADIAIVVLKNDVVFNMYIRPACMWSGSSNLDFVVGERGKVIGWGKTNDESKGLSHIPHQIEASIISNKNCFKENDNFRSLSSNRTFCAGDKDVRSQTPCPGDSGAGLMLFRNNRWMLRGTVSASLAKNGSSSSCQKSDYVLYTDVSKFLDWIYAFIL